MRTDALKYATDNLLLLSLRLAEFYSAGLGRFIHVDASS